MCGPTAVDSDYCTDDKITGGAPNALYHCSGPSRPATLVQICSEGCVTAPAGFIDYCHATCANNVVPGSTYCAGDKITGGVPDTLYRCDTAGGSATRLRFCVDGCATPPGANDFCQ